jgi:hypothetical protein
MTTLPVAELNTQRAKAVGQPWTDSAVVTDHVRVTGDAGRVFLSVRNVEVGLTRAEAAALVDAVCEAIKDAEL